MTAYQRHQLRVEALKKHTGPIEGFRKRSISNLFRYQPTAERGNRVDLRRFDQLLSVDMSAMTVDVEGLCTIEHLSDALLRYGALPYVVPGLKHITIGGALVGISFDAPSFKYGFTHDHLIEAEVLLPTGEVVVCTATNEYQDLFKALPNSYGTLGYILRAKLHIHLVAPFITLTTTKYTNVPDYLDALQRAATNDTFDAVESLVYSDHELYVTTGQYTAAPTSRPMSIYGATKYYREISQVGTRVFAAKEYLFRYDPEWFWGLPDGGVYELFRRIAPQSIRNSRTYKRYFTWQQKRTGGSSDREMLIQDWLVPWQQAKVLLETVLTSIDIFGKPWMPTPITPQTTPTLYPVQPNETLFNLGCYTFARTDPAQAPYQATKMMDHLCAALGGIKMLYSSSFYDRSTFDHMFNGALYQTVRKKYDPNHRLPDLFDKVTLKT